MANSGPRGLRTVKVAPCINGIAGWAGLKNVRGAGEPTMVVSGDSRSERAPVGAEPDANLAALRALVVARLDADKSTQAAGRYATAG